MWKAYAGVYIYIYIHIVIYNITSCFLFCLILYIMFQEVSTENFLNIIKLIKIRLLLVLHNFTYANKIS